MKKLTRWNYASIVITLWYFASAVFYFDINIAKASRLSFSLPGWLDNIFGGIITFGLGVDEGWLAALLWVPVAVAVFAVCGAIFRSSYSTVHRVLIAALPLAAAVLAVIDLVNLAPVIPPVIFAAILIIWCVTDIVMTCKSKKNN